MSTRPAGPDEAFDDLIRKRILDAYGYGSVAELDAAIEAELPGYLAAEAEYKAQQAAFKAEVEARGHEFAAEYTARLHADGILPEGVALRFEYADE